MQRFLFSDMRSLHEGHGSAMIQRAASVAWACMYQAKPLAPAPENARHARTNDERRGPGREETRCLGGWGFRPGAEPSSLLLSLLLRFARQPTAPAPVRHRFAFPQTRSTTSHNVASKSSFRMQMVMDIWIRVCDAVIAIKTMHMSVHSCWGML